MNSLSKQICYTLLIMYIILYHLIMGNEFKINVYKMNLYTSNDKAAVYSNIQVVLPIIVFKYV